MSLKILRRRNDGFIPLKLILILDRLEWLKLGYLILGFYCLRSCHIGLELAKTEGSKIQEIFQLNFFFILSFVNFTGKEFVFASLAFVFISEECFRLGAVTLLDLDGFECRETGTTSCSMILIILVYQIMNLILLIICDSFRL